MDPPKAMETFVANYGACMLYLESLSQTDPGPAKREELKRWLSKGYINISIHDSIH